MGIFEAIARLRADKEDETKRASEQYAELVTRGGKGQSKKTDTAEFIGQLLKAVGKSPDDLAADVERAAHEHRQRELAATFEAIQKELAEEIERSGPLVTEAKEQAKAAKENAVKIESEATRRRREIDARLRLASEAVVFIENLDQRRAEQETALG